METNGSDRQVVILNSSVSSPILPFLFSNEAICKKHYREQKDTTLIGTGATKKKQNQKQSLTTKSNTPAGANSSSIKIPHTNCPAPGPCHRKSFSLDQATAHAVATANKCHQPKHKPQHFILDDQKDTKAHVVPSSLQQKTLKQSERTGLDTGSCSSNSTFTPKRCRDVKSPLDDVMASGVGTWTIRVHDNEKYANAQSYYTGTIDNNNSSSRNFISYYNEDRSDSTTKVYRDAICFEMKKKNRKNSSVVLFGFEIIHACVSDN
jgi:hypothetical protein